MAFKTGQRTLAFADSFTGWVTHGCSAAGQAAALTLAPGGTGLAGYTTVGTAPSLSTSGSRGVVAALGQVATQAYQTARLSRVAIRGPVPQDCCTYLFFQDPLLCDPLPALPGDGDALPVEEWKRG